MTFRKDDAGKPRFDLIDPLFEIELAEILAHGAVKYAANNWQRAVPSQARERYYAALRRHLAAWYAGEETDPDSGLPHLASVAFCTMALRWFDRQTGGMRAFIEARALDDLPATPWVPLPDDDEDAEGVDEEDLGPYKPHRGHVGFRGDDE